MLGIMSGMACAGWVGAAYGWRTALFFAAAPGILLAVTSWIWLRAAVPTARTVSTPADVATSPVEPAQNWTNPQYILLVALAVYSHRVPGRTRPVAGIDPVS